MLQYARKSVGIKDEPGASKTAVKWFVERIIELDEQLSEIQNRINEKCQEIPHAENVLEISGWKILFQEYLQKWGIFQDLMIMKEIQKN